ncbi:hypothetical protein [Azospirillum argentinense]|uniref:Uncharacterized protein n=1 Tax=Azospirillum argentinense TaxID=2970906 RepID=A0A5B0L031_9PROT|nr:hypothetical protein FH063_003861 [Azospirillum argentinense]
MNATALPEKFGTRNTQVVSSPYTGDYVIICKPARCADGAV